MGTNYYHHLGVCKHCGRGDEPVHIGRSSFGWCFSLHVGGEAPVDLNGWQERWDAGGVIKDEYGDVVEPTEMLLIITNRFGRHSFDDPNHWSNCGYSDEAQFHALNESERGPNNLVRHRIGRHCIGHGAGTWDLIPGEFS